MAQFTLNYVAIPTLDFEATARFYELLGGKRGFYRADAAGRPELLQIVIGDQFLELVTLAIKLNSPRRSPTNPLCLILCIFEAGDAGVLITQLKGRPHDKTAQHPVSFARPAQA